MSEYVIPGLRGAIGTWNNDRLKEALKDWLTHMPPAVSETFNGLSGQDLCDMNDCSGDWKDFKADIVKETSLAVWLKFQRILKGIMRPVQIPYCFALLLILSFFHKL